jgi:hypothetical protein
MLKRIFLMVFIIIFSRTEIYSQLHGNLCPKNNNEGTFFYKHRDPESPDSTDACNIVLSDGTQLKDVKFLGSNDTGFTIIKNTGISDFPISRIHKITFEHHNFGKGVLIGALTSFAFWGILGICAGTPESMKLGLTFGAIFAIPAGLIVGMIAEFTSGEDIYNFSTINPLSRSQRLKKVILEHM